MNKISLLLTVLLFSLTQAQTFEWVDVVPLELQTNPSFLHGTVAMDNSGNPVCARLIEYQELYNLNYIGVVKIEKRNSFASLMWENTINGKADVLELIVDGENNTVCIGAYRDTISIDTEQLIHSGSGTGSFILKLDDSGNLIWIKDGTEFFSGFEVMTAIEKDGFNNYLLGISNYPFDSKIIKLDADGNVISSIDQTNVKTISDINQDLFDNIWVTGFTSADNQSFNGLDTIAPFPYTEYVVKYNSSGTAEWVNFIEDITVQEFKIETDNEGNAYLSGNIFTSTNFGNLTANGPQWVYDFFVTKISHDGNFIWLNEIPPDNPTGDAIIGNSNFLFCNEDGNTYITGSFRGTINLGNGVILNPIVSNDIFVISYNTDGEVQWAKVAGSGTYDNGSSITGDNNGNLYLSGVVGENSVFDTITVAGGSQNLFLTKLKTDDVVSVDNLPENNQTANGFALMQNYPNPFNPVTNIKYTLPSSANVTLNVFNTIGQEVLILVNKFKEAGTYQVSFNAVDFNSGVYFYKLQAGNFSEIKKMILLK